MNRLTKWIVDRLMNDKETLDYVLENKKKTSPFEAVTFDKSIQNISSFKMESVSCDVTALKELLDNDMFTYIELASVEEKIKRILGEEIYPYVQIARSCDRYNGKYHYFASVHVCKDFAPVRNDLKDEINDYKATHYGN